MKKKTSENRREFIRYASKIVQEWNGHLEISVSRPQLIENSQAIFASPNSYFTENIVLSCPGWPVKTIYFG